MALPNCPSNVSFLTGDLLKSTIVDCIVQQCNCLAVRPHGLSDTIAKAFSYGNMYGTRRSIGNNRNLACPEDRSKVGTCTILKGDGPYIVCLFGQYQYGKPNAYQMGDYKNNKDDALAREGYFLLALDDFFKQATQINENHKTDPTIKPIQVLGFPYEIGCGFAGGKWTNYLTMINEFAEKHPEFKIIIYQLPLNHAYGKLFNKRNATPIVETLAKKQKIDSNN